MSDRYAPAGKVWLCMMCGKTAKDYCTDARGWDESCALNCILVDEATKRPTEAEAGEFHAERERHLAGMQQRTQTLIQQLTDGTYETDPELLELARKVIAARGSGETERERG